MGMCKYTVGKFIDITLVQNNYLCLNFNDDLKFLERNISKLFLRLKKNLKKVFL